MAPEKIDVWLGILQKFSIICGVIASAWFFLLKDEHSPHIKIEMLPQPMSDCMLRVDIEAENVGVREWELNSGIVRVFVPSTDRIYDANSREEREVGTQIRNFNQVLKPKEKAYFGFNLKIQRNTDSSFLVAVAALNIEEENEKWIRIAEKAINIDGC